MSEIIHTRETKYTREVLLILTSLGHATNIEILSGLRQTYPDLSATTVHRLTSRLAERGSIGVAPVDSQGSMRYDSNVLPHDHFVCTVCGGIRDLHVAEELIPTISQALGGCKITGQLLIHGSCEICAKRGVVK